MEKGSLSIDPLTDEQIKKRALGIENVDYKGLVKRHRVLEQTLFDLLFMKNLITQSQHEAAHLFIEAMSLSGATVKSANLDVEIFTPYRDAANTMGERRMAFSSAYRRVVRDCGDDRARILMRYLARVYEYPPDYGDQKLVAKLIGPGLKSLAIFYEIADLKDPRDIILEMK